MFFLLIACIANISTLYTMDDFLSNNIPKSLVHKQILLHNRNLVDIFYSELTVPPLSTTPFLAAIYNMIQLLQEPEVKKLPQQLSNLYNVINVRKFKHEDLITQKHIDSFSVRYSAFNQKLLNRQAFTDLQPNAITDEINKLDNEDLKNLFHAFVAFYTCGSQAEQTMAENKLSLLREKFPDVVPAVVDIKPLIMTKGTITSSACKDPVHIIEIYDLNFMPK